MVEKSDSRHRHYHAVLVTCVNNIYNSTSGMKCLLLLFGFAILVYMAALVIDQLRKYCWQRIWSLYSKQ